MPGATVAVRDSNGAIIGTTTADSNGNFTVPVSLPSGTVVNVEAIVRGVTSNPTTTIARSSRGVVAGGTAGAGGGADGPGGGPALPGDPLPPALGMRPEYAMPGAGEGVALDGERAVELTKTRTPDSAGLQLAVGIGADRWVVELRPAPVLVTQPAKAKGAPPVTKPMQPVTNNDVLHVVRGNTVVTTGAGFAPNSTVNVYLVETGVLLGAITTDEHGSFTRTFMVPANTPLGTRTAQVLGTSPKGAVRMLSVGIDVTAQQLTARYKKNKGKLRKRSIQELRAMATGSGASVAEITQYQAKSKRGKKLANKRAATITRLMNKIGLDVDLSIEKLTVKKVPATRYSYVQIEADQTRADGKVDNTVTKRKASKPVKTATKQDAKAQAKKQAAKADKKAEKKPAKAKSSKKAKTDKKAKKK